MSYDDKYEAVLLGLVIVACGFLGVANMYTIPLALMSVPAWTLVAALIVKLMR